MSRAVQHATDIDAHNDNNPWGGQLKLYDYDFNADSEASHLPEDYPDEDSNAWIREPSGFPVQERSQPRQLGVQAHSP